MNLYKTWKNTDACYPSGTLITRINNLKKNASLNTLIENIIDDTFSDYAYLKQKIKIRITAYLINTLDTDIFSNIQIRVCVREILTHNKLPTTVSEFHRMCIYESFEDEKLIIAHSGDIVSANKSDICSICLDVFDKDDDIVKLKCGHCYHQPDNCIDGGVVEWIKKIGTCPMCRNNLIESHENLDS